MGSIVGIWFSTETRSPLTFFLLTKNIEGAPSPTGTSLWCTWTSLRCVRGCDSSGTTFHCNVSTIPAVPKDILSETTTDHLTELTWIFPSTAVHIATRRGVEIRKSGIPQPKRIASRSWGIPQSLFHSFGMHQRHSCGPLIKGSWEIPTSTVVSGFPTHPCAFWWTCRIL